MECNIYESSSGSPFTPSPGGRELWPRKPTGRTLTARSLCTAGRAGWSAWGLATPLRCRCCGRTASPSWPCRCTPSAGSCGTSGRRSQHRKRKLKRAWFVITAQRLLLKKKSQLHLDSLLLVLTYYYCVLLSINYHLYQFSSVRSLSRLRLFATPWTAARQASLSTTNSRSLLKLLSIESVMPSNHLILCCPPLLPPSIFPTITIYFHMHWRNPHTWLWRYKYFLKKLYLHFKRLLKFCKECFFFFFFFLVRWPDIVSRWRDYLVPYSWMPSLGGKWTSDVHKPPKSTVFCYSITNRLRLKQLNLRHQLTFSPCLLLKIFSLTLGDLKVL